MLKVNRWLAHRVEALLDSGHSFRRPELSLLVFGGAILLFVAVPPQTLERLPSLSVWVRLFGYSPSTGTLRALASLFHGRPQDALAYNWNVVITAPLITSYLFLDIVAVLKRHRRHRPSIAAEAASEP